MNKHVVIDGVTYVPRGTERVTCLDKMEYKIIRTESAGVFAGYIEKRADKEVTIRNARRLWYWDGAASLSQLATEGVKKPENCKFPCEVNRITVTGAVEILSCTEKARQSIAGVKVWEA
jgi:hypothetical protein